MPALILIADNRKAGTHKGRPYEDNDKMNMVRHDDKCVQCDLLEPFR